MLVIRSKAKKQYLDALGKADKIVGPVPSDGAHATLEQARDFVTYISRQMEDTIENNLRFIGEKADAVWWYDGELITFKNVTTITILNAMLDNPKVTTKQIAETAGVSATSIQKQLVKLQENKYIVRIGGIKNGEWKVNLIRTNK